MIEVKLVDGMPSADDYLRSTWLLVRDAAMLVALFGDDELEAAASADVPPRSQEAGEDCIP